MFDLIIDTETTHEDGEIGAKLDAHKQVVYDLGGVVRDTKTGEIVDSFSFIISEIFYNDDLMKSAYYVEKKPIYLANENDQWEVVSFKYAYRYVHKLIKKYKIRTVWAYNMYFDYTVLNNTIANLSNGYNQFFFPYGIKIKDIMGRCSNIYQTKKYKEWAIEKGYITTRGVVRHTAEFVARYITDNSDLIEKHTALADAELEAMILTVAQRKHKKANKGFQR